MTDLKMAGAKRHETDVAERLGGRKTRGSGSQWHDKGDGRNEHFGSFPFAWDCKSTQRQSISVTLAMLEKIIEEAHGDRPALPLRFYSNARLDVAQDWIVVKLDDFTEILETARRAHGAVHIELPEHLTDEQVEEFRQQISEALAGGVYWQPRPAGDPDLVMALGRTQQAEARAVARAELAEENVAALQRQLDEARAQLAPPPEVQLIPATFTEEDKQRLRDEILRELAGENEPVGLVDEIEQPPGMAAWELPPRVPWTVIRTEGRRHAGVHWNAMGHPAAFEVTEVRTEPTSSTTERLMVNNQVVRAGDLYIDGRLRLRVGA